MLWLYYYVRIIWCLLLVVVSTTTKSATRRDHHTVYTIVISMTVYVENETIITCNHFTVLWLILSSSCIVDMVHGWLMLLLHLSSRVRRLDPQFQVRMDLFDLNIGTRVVPQITVDNCLARFGDILWDSFLKYCVLYTVRVDCLYLVPNDGVLYSRVRMVKT